MGDPDVATLVLGEDGRANFRGVTRCGSPWACPVCAPKVAAARAEALRPQIAALMEAGWTAWSITLTVSHDAGHDLAELWRVLGKAWSRLTSGKRWQEIRDLGGVEYVRGSDLTHSPRHGWHPHMHLTLLLGPEHGGSGAVPRWLLARWISVLAKMGWKAVPGAQHVVRADDPEAAARYAVTPAAVYEAVSMATKRARKKGVPSRTPFEILQAAASEGGRSTELWREYVTATKGRRQVTVSRGLHLREDVEDVDESVGQAIADIGTFAMTELDRRRLSAVLLDAVEMADPADVFEAAASVLRQLNARDWGLCRPPPIEAAEMPEVRPQPPAWVIHDPRKGKPGTRGEAAIRAYEEWRASQH
jgi:hypothetical protein